ncbi:MULTISPECIES: hypothetical protein [unclassified Streptomyces]|uniref:hypothetical protein n=1 Tax=unclassified Streptomyces TaxID=2593676 RepID=UPI0036E2035D
MHDRTTPPDPIRDLLVAVLDAIDVPFDVVDYDRQLGDRARLAVVVGRAALEEDPAGIPWNVDYLRAYLRAKLAAEGADQ